MEDKETVVVKAYVDQSFYQLITDECNKTGASISSLIRIALVKLLEDYEYIPASYQPKQDAL